MNEEKNVMEKIYNAPAEDLPLIAQNEIKEAVSLLEDYANKIVKKSDIIKNRRILANLLHVLYKDVFLLQTEDLKNIYKYESKGEQNKECNMCNNDVVDNIELKKTNEKDELKGLCLDCFISTVKDEDWWDETWTHLK